MKHVASQNDSFAAMESAGRLIRSLGNGELLKQYALFCIHGMHLSHDLHRFESSHKKMSRRFTQHEEHNEVGFFPPQFSESISSLTI